MRRLPYLFAAFLLLFTLAATCCPTKKPSVLYVAFGDSVTDSDAEIKYPWYLKEWLGLSDDQIENEGNSGETIAEGLPRLREILECGTYPNAGIVLFEEGGNDLIDWIQELDPSLSWSPLSPLYPYSDGLQAKLAEIEGSLFQAAEAVLASGSDMAIMTYFHVLPYKSPCKLTPLNFFTVGQAERVNQYVNLLNERILNVAGIFGLPVADVASTGALYGDYDNYLNCNHPSAAGNEVLAQFFLDAILEAGQVLPPVERTEPVYRLIQ